MRIGTPDVRIEKTIMRIGKSNVRIEFFARLADFQKDSPDYPPAH